MRRSVGRAVGALSERCAAFVVLATLGCDVPDPRTWWTAASEQPRLTEADRALLDAARRGDAQAIDAALRAGGLPDARSDDVFDGVAFPTPALVLAARDGHIEAVAVLVRAGAQLDQTSGLGGETALLSAAIDGHVEVVDALIVAGADFERPNEWGKTPLMWAADNRHATVVRRLLDAGADATRRDADGRNAADYADDPATAALLR